MVIAWFKKAGMVFTAIRQVYKNKDLIKKEVKEAINKTKNMDADKDGKVSIQEAVSAISEWVDVLRVIAPNLEYLIGELRGIIKLKEKPGSTEEV